MVTHGVLSALTSVWQTGGMALCFVLPASGVLLSKEQLGAEYRQAEVAESSFRECTAEQKPWRGDSHNIKGNSAQTENRVKRVNWRECGSLKVPGFGSGRKGSSGRQDPLEKKMNLTVVDADLEVDI